MLRFLEYNSVKVALTFIVTIYAKRSDVVPWELSPLREKTVVNEWFEWMGDWMTWLWKRADIRRLEIEVKAIRDRGESLFSSPAVFTRQRPDFGLKAFWVKG
jgi:hypothetical protein